MKTKTEMRINVKTRTRLEEVIPLSTPFVIQVEPTNLCNIKCRFCPVGNHTLIKQKNIKQGTLALKLFRKIINDLHEFENNIKSIHLYGNGEPLLNKDFHKMIKYAKESGYVEFIDTTTNGLLLTHEKVEQIINSGIDKINISVNGLTSEQYLNITETKIDFNKFIDNLTYLYENRGKCKILIKSISELYNEENKKLFFEMFSPISDYTILENLTNPWHNYDIEKEMSIKTTKSAFSEKAKDKYVCCPIFYTLIVNFDGTISLCCVDWENNLIIGDIKNNSLKEIWNSDILFKYQIQHLKGERFNNPICCDCKQISQCVYDNIDPYRFNLLNKLEKSHIQQLSEIRLFGDV